MKYKGVELTEAQLRAGMQCETADECAPCGSTR